jgi:predicted nucleic acid-binding protein
MICADTSSLIAYLQGEAGSDVIAVDRALIQQSLALAPVSLAELLSDPALPAAAEAFVLAVPLLEITAGFWERAGRLRRKVLGHRYRTRIADSLIAQSCLDHGVPLITRDQDFKAFHRIAGLQLL